MDHEILVSTFQSVIQTLRQRTGTIALFLLNALDTENTSWNIVVSTQGYDQITIKTALNDFLTILEQHMPNDLLKNILRVTILKTSDPFVKAVNSAFGGTENPQDVYSRTIDDVYIERGILFESHAVQSAPKIVIAKKNQRRKKPKTVVSAP